MYGHTVLVLFPFFSLFSIIIMALRSFMASFLERWNVAHSTLYVNLYWSLSWVIGAKLIFHFYGYRFMFIHGSAIVLAFIIDMILIAALCSFGWITVMKHKKETAQFIIWIIAFSATVSHFIFSLGFLCEWDWIFRPFIGQGCLDQIAIMREDDSMNRADREEQDYWNSITNTITD